MALLKKAKKYFFITTAIIFSLALLTLLLMLANTLSVNQDKPVTGIIESLPDSAPKDEISIITYNIAHARGNTSNKNLTDFERDFTIQSEEAAYEGLDKIAEMLKTENADIIALQEADLDATWSFNVDFLPYLAEKAGYKYYAFAYRWNVIVPYFNKRYNAGYIFPFLKVKAGVAVLSKYPSGFESRLYRKKTFIEWVIGANHYLDAVVDIGGKKLRVLDAHLDSESTENKMLEARALITDVRATGTPSVVLGDLNAVLPIAKSAKPERLKSFKNDMTMESFIESGLFEIYMQEISPEDERFMTANTDELHKAIDFILPTKDIVIKEYKVLEYVHSDHRAVKAVLVI
ncbi:MAG: endonuclease/exonuclease/phosphatase family protein [Nanoarchaeota archaeon]|nr:endonuclease/exonuclease/phosphatase family protein [Nanoarchaeota archaeon]